MSTITGRQRLIMFLLLGTQFMLSVDFSILNVAMPQVGAGIGMEMAALPWLATAYALPAAGFTLLCGRIADMVGRRRMFLAGVALLACASLLGGFADDPGLLLTARALQGFASAVATPAALALLTTTFSDERLRARVLGLNGALLSGGFTVGALVGGALVDALGWRFAFLVNVPVAVLILVMTPLVVRASSVPMRVPLDVPGALTVTLGLLSFAFGVTNHNPLALVAGLVLLVAFWMIERRAAAPLAAVAILSRPTVKWGNIAGLAIATEAGSIFVLTLYLQDVLHFTPSTTGLVFGVPGVASVMAGIVAGRFLARFGKRAVLTVGMTVQGVSLAALVPLGSDPGWLWLLVPALFVGFFGHVTAIVAFLVTATSDLPDTEQGLATGLATLTQQIGLTVSVPILAAVVATQTNLLGGVQLALGVAAVVTVTAAVGVWTGLRPRPIRSVATVREPALGRMVA